MNKEKVKESLQYIFKENSVVDNETKSRIFSKMTTSPKKKRIVLMPAVVMIFLLLGTAVWSATMFSNNNNTQNAVTTEVQQENAEYQMQESTDETSKIAELEFEVSRFEEEREYYHSVISRMMSKLNNEEMLELAKSHFSYDIKVNQQQLPNDGRIEVDPGEVDVLLTFSMTPHYNVLSEEWYEKGMISGDYFSHITHVEPNNWEEIYADGSNVTARGYKFKNLKSGSIISMSISEELKERLSLNTTNIEIVVK